MGRVGALSPGYALCAPPGVNHDLVPPALSKRPLKFVVLACNFTNYRYICIDMKLIELNMDKIIALCRKYKVAKLWVFGSILTDRFNDNSDVDFSVNFDSDTINREQIDWADLFFDFIDEMKTVLGRDVDIVFDDCVKNPYFKKELDSTKKLIYG